MKIHTSLTLLSLMAALSQPIKAMDNEAPNKGNKVPCSLKDDNLPYDKLATQQGYEKGSKRRLPMVPQDGSEWAY